MKHQEGTFIGVRDTEIFYQCWIPEEEVKAVLILVHGFAEHSGRYDNVVEVMEEQSIAVYALDHRGHGRSGGPQNYVNRFSDYIEDLSKFESIVFEQYPEKPYFLLGHSMGSLIATHFMADNENQEKYSSLILSGTGADFGPGINKLTIYLGKFLSFILPKMSIPSNLDPEFISRDNDVVEEYLNDPLVHPEKITARLGSEMLKHTALMKDAASRIGIPVLIQIGSEDDAFAADSRKPLYEAFPNDTKELKIYDGFRHEVYNELEKEKALDDLQDWINQFL